MSDKISLIVENIKLPITSTDDDAESVAVSKIKKLRGVGNVVSADVYKRSVDARKKNDICFVYSVSVEVETALNFDVTSSLPSGVRVKNDEEVKIDYGDERLVHRPVIVGFGPAGMFCALTLAGYGFRPLVLERGADVDKRTAAVKKFTEYGVLDTETNVQFGAGGAGTFSDGKLTTRIGDKYVQHVLKVFSESGAPRDVIKKAKPHIGTDVLCKVVKDFHEKIVSLGGEIRYNSKVTEIGDGFVTVGGERIETDAAVIATGHSARDIYSTLAASSYEIAAKPFSVGVRIEHLTRDIDRAMYGDEALAERLGHAEYSLSKRNGDRGVYTFCMCPGGEVIAAASEEFGVVTNGMSNSRRDGVNSNAAVAVSVLPRDFGDDPKKAIDFQRNLEHSAFVAGGGNYHAPCQTVGNFLSGKCADINGKVTPTYMNGKVTPCDLNRLFPEYITSMLADGICDFGRKIKGFDDADSPLTGVESRTSAPVRIMRGEGYTAIGKAHVYPCGEGAGYAGGIVSAAVDGIRVAEAIIKKYKPN